MARMEKHITVKIEKCKKCKREMGDRFTSELGISSKWLQSSPYCFNCGKTIDKAHQKRKWNKIFLGAKVEKIDANYNGCTHIYFKNGKHQFRIFTGFSSFGYQLTEQEIRKKGCKNGRAKRTSY